MQAWYLFQGDMNAFSLVIFDLHFCYFFFQFSDLNRSQTNATLYNQLEIWATWVEWWQKWEENWGVISHSQQGNYFCRLLFVYYYFFSSLEMLFVFIVKLAFFYSLPSFSLSFLPSFLYSFLPTFSLPSFLPPLFPSSLYPLPPFFPFFFLIFKVLLPLFFSPNYILLIQTDIVWSHLFVTEPILSVTETDNFSTDCRCSPSSLFQYYSLNVLMI